MSKGKIMEQGCHEELVTRNGIYATLVKAQNLTPTHIEKSHDSEDSSTPDGSSDLTDDHVKPVQSLATVRTAETQHLATLKDREDHELYEKSGIIHNVWRLLKGTPEIWSWFAVAMATCIAGG
jgi:ATP-binding cassette, subfamily B (MDR/TAP), member 1